ncbi:MAG: hypothetical protein ACFFCQ_11300 [Promethearchaeota archaeon]
MPLNKFSSHAIRIVEQIKEFRAIVLLIIACILVSDLREYPTLFDIVLSPVDTIQIILDANYYPGKSVMNLLGSLLRFIFYPINMLLFQKDFEDADVPEIYLLLVPFIFLFSIGLIIIISTED